MHASITWGIPQEHPPPNFRSVAVGYEYPKIYLEELQLYWWVRDQLGNGNASYINTLSTVRTASSYPYGTGTVLVRRTSYLYPNPSIKKRDVRYSVLFGPELAPIPGRNPCKKGGSGANLENPTSW